MLAGGQISGVTCAVSGGVTVLVKVEAVEHVGDGVEELLDQVHGVVWRKE